MRLSLGPDKAPQAKNMMVKPMMIHRNGPRVILRSGEVDSGLSSRRSGGAGRLRGSGVDMGSQCCDKGEITVFLGVIKPVANYKFRRDIETDVFDINWLF